MLQPLELVDVERLQADELLSGDQRHLLGRVHSCMSLRGQVTVTTCSNWAPPSNTSAFMHALICSLSSGPETKTLSLHEFNTNLSLKVVVKMLR